MVVWFSAGMLACVHRLYTTLFRKSARMPLILYTCGCVHNVLPQLWRPHSVFPPVVLSRHPHADHQVTAAVALGAVAASEVAVAVVVAVETPSTLFLLG